MLMTLGMLAFSACESDRDSNPTLNEPDSFVLNTPPYAESIVYDLANSNFIEFSCSQPDYGVPMATTYSVQMGLSDAFTDENKDAETKANYVTLSTVFTSTKMSVDATELALALIDLWDVAGTGDFPKETISLYFRFKAHITSTPSKGVCYSNIVKLTNVQGYKPESPVALPETMYMIGSFEGSDWNIWSKMISVTETPGKFWKIQFFKNNDTMKFNMANSWQGTQVAYSEGLVPEESKILAGVSGVDDGNGGLNINIGKDGWYTVVVTVKLAGKNLVYTLEFFNTSVYLTGDGLTEGWGVEKDEYKFIAPATPQEPFISPAATQSGNLRSFVKIPNSDWWRSEFVVFDNQIRYRENGGELAAQGFATTVPTGKKVKYNFITGAGSVE